MQNVILDNYLQGDGVYAERVENELFSIAGTGDYKLVPSCTAGLELASLAMKLKPNDEVIMPDFNFTSSAISVTKLGAKPIFIDIDASTKCINAELIEEKITEHTRAISWVNYAGGFPNIELIKNLAKKYNLFLIEDNAHSLGIKDLGITGDFVLQSYHATKNIQCGEGGSIKTQKKEFLNLLHQLREKGTNRKEFKLGRVDKYEWVNEGGSILLPEICAAILYSQLEEFNEIQKARQNIYEYYVNELSDILTQKKFIWSNLSSHKESAHIFFIDLGSEKLAHTLIRKSKALGIEINSHYQSLSNSIYARKNNLHNNSSNESLQTSKSLVRLPIYPSLGDKVEIVAEIVRTTIQEFEDA